MIAYQYPPEGSSSGVLRTLKFSKYLPINSWIPHVLTLKESFYPVKDVNLLKEIPPEAVVHRTFALDSGRHLAIRGRYPALLAIPDRFVSWIPFGVAKGLQVARSADVNVLYSTSPPPTTHLIAASIKALTGLPWVADFRDPWIEEGLHPRPGTIRYRFEKKLERFVVHGVDRLIVTTSYLRREFLSRYPELRKEKVHVNCNGYDEADFQELEYSKQNSHFEIIHAGLVTPEFRDPFPLLKAVSSLIADGELQYDETRVRFLGGGSYLLSERFKKDVERLRLEGVVRVDGRVPHQEALQSLGRAAVLLLLQASDDTRSLIPAKAFEYLRIGRPILALTLKGATGDLLQDMDQCYIVAPNDQRRLREAVMQGYASWKQSTSSNHMSRPICVYERGVLTKQLSQLLEDLSST